MISLTVNGKQYDVDVSPDTPLLWVIRDAIGLTGTKFGCGLQQCGACTVHLDGVAVRSCGTAVSTVGNKESHDHRRACRRHRITRCKRHGLPSRFLNAAIVSQDKSCRRQRSWRRSPNPPMQKSMPPCRATSADAAHISASAAPFIARPAYKEAANVKDS